MRIVTKHLVLIFLSVCALATHAASLPTAKPESVGMSGERLERINIAMQRHIDAGDIQGAVTAIARRGKVVHFQAHGLMDVEKNRPMEKDAIFIMMSSTKPVLGVAAMMMMEEGLIRPDDPVSKYIPEFADMRVAVLKDPSNENVSPRRVDRNNIPAHRSVPAERPVTIEHLLTHTSGLMSGGLGSAVATPMQRETLASYIPRLGEVLLDFQPGSRWTYSPGTGLDVVARIVEMVSETPYDQFLQERIFDPLGMKDTHYNLPSEKESRRVEIHDRDMSRFRRGSTGYFSGSYGLSSTAEDYLRFEQMLASGGELFGNRLLSPRSVKMMGSNHIGDLYGGFTGTQQGVGYGYTVAVTLDPIAADARRGEGAFGWGGAFGTRSWTDPSEELTGVIMLQQPHPGTQYDFENAVQQAIID
jgi:CubicO group peptidase (beta-lactamase class C family)